MRQGFHRRGKTLLLWLGSVNPNGVCTVVCFHRISSVDFDHNHVSMVIRPAFCPPCLRFHIKLVLVSACQSAFDSSRISVPQGNEMSRAWAKKNPPHSWRVPVKN